MTKVGAVKKLLEDIGGVATWEQIYENIEEYYPKVTRPKDWKEALRGVVYREIYAGKNFKKAGLGIIALLDYQEILPDMLPGKEDTHSYIEGMLLEIGNFNGYLTYTPDKAKIFKGGILLQDLTTIDEVPEFTYPDMLREIQRIDVLWFSNEVFKFPRRAFEVVHSQRTLIDALNRCLNLVDFRLDGKLTIIGPEENRKFFEDSVEKRPYTDFRDHFDFKNYHSVTEFYEESVRLDKVKQDFFR